MSKGQRGMSILLQQACKAAQNNGSDIQQQVRKVGNVFLSHVELEAQEAAYILLQMPLRKASREFVFINTSIPDERVVLVKSCSSLEEFPKNSTAIEADNNIKRYQRRPGTMNNYCLADYVALLNVKFSKQTPKSVNFIENEERNVELREDSYELDVIDDPYYNENESTIANEDEEHFARDGSVLTKRKTPRVIYSVGFNKEHDKENYYRELIMLYLPWRNDTNLISGYMSYEDKYKENQELIENNRQKYVNSNTVFITELEKEGLNDECAQDDVVTE